MTRVEPQGQIPETFYEKLLSFAVNQGQMEKIRSSYSEVQVRKNNKKCINFCKELSREWIVETLNSPSVDKTEKEEKRRLVNLEKVCRNESDAEIYSYLLYFCGISFLLKGKEKEDKEYRDALREFFESQIQRTEDSNRMLLFRFLITYIDLVDPKKEDIIVFNDLKECLTNDKHNKIFQAIKEEHNLMLEILEHTPKRNEFRQERIGQVFPKELEKNENIEETKIIEIIESILDSRIAAQYHSAGREREDDHISKLNEALKLGKGYPDNSYALLQTAHFVLKYGEELDKKKALDMEDRLQNLSDLVDTIKTADLAVKLKINTKNYLGASEYLFKKIIKLIDDDNQFNDFKPFNYKIKFESLLGLAYIYYKRGQGQKAEEKYAEAEEIIDKHLSGNKDSKDKEGNMDKYYLKSITRVNRGRNKYDNRPVTSESTAKEDFEYVLTMYNTARTEIKHELAELTALAHNNLGIYFLNDADYENAEKQFRKAIDVDDTNAHARYNLGVLYHMTDEDDRAKTLFQNAHSLDSKIPEASEALEKLSAMKKGGLGSEWFKWWFESKKEAKGTLRIAGRRLSIWPIRPIVASALIFVMFTAFGMLAFNVYLCDFVHHLSGPCSPASVDVDENGFLVIIAVSLVILMLPFINKLKMGDIEMDLETAGYKAKVPVALGARAPPKAGDIFPLIFLFARFWY
jgi:tetratricopeptide (TPR) repeat protein